MTQPAALRGAETDGPHFAKEVADGAGASSVGDRSEHPSYGDRQFSEIRGSETSSQIVGFGVSAGPSAISRDEMNLAEFPLTVLSTRAQNQTKTLEFADTVRGKNGEQIERKWIITGADKFGLPTSSDDEVMLGLMKLTVDNGFRDRKVYFTRYELLRALRWTTEGRSYIRLQRALDRLSGVRIKASNAFYDNQAKGYSTRNFGIVDAYEINDGRDASPKPSFFIWSEVLFQSFQTGFIKKLDLQFYLGLGSAISKRLYRFLDKHFWYRARVQINLFTLAHEKVGVSRNYRHVSSLRQQLDPAFEELIQQKFLSRVEYVGRGEGTEVSIYSQQRTPRSQLSTRAPLSGRSQTATTSPAVPPAVAPAGPPEAGSEGSRHGVDHATGSEHQGDSVAAPVVATVDRTALRGPSRGAQDIASEVNEASLEGLQEALETRGLNPAQARRLLSGHSQAALCRIARIIEYFDALRSSGSRLVSRSPVGFLYRAVENPDNFILPGEQRGLKEQTSLALSRGGRPNHRSDSMRYGSYAQHERAGPKSASTASSPCGFPATFLKASPATFRTTIPTASSNACSAMSSAVSPVVSTKRAHSDEGGAKARAPALQGEYLIARKVEVSRLRGSTEPAVLERTRAEVELKLVKLKSLLSGERFREVVEHGVDERLLALFAFPSFAEWQGRRSRGGKT